MVRVTSDGRVLQTNRVTGVLAGGALFDWVGQEKSEM